MDYANGQQKRPYPTRHYTYSPIALSLSYFSLSISFLFPSFCPLRSLITAGRQKTRHRKTREEIAILENAT